MSFPDRVKEFERCLQKFIIEDRNLSAYTYDEFLAEMLYGRLNNHLLAMKQLLNNIRGGKDV